jgi:hypothetical protein
LFVLNVPSILKAGLHHHRMPAERQAADAFGNRSSTVGKSGCVAFALWIDEGLPAATAAVQLRAGMRYSPTPIPPEARPPTAQGSLFGDADCWLMSLSSGLGPVMKTCFCWFTIY